MKAAALTVFLLVFIPYGWSHCDDSYSNLSHCDCSPEILNCTSKGTWFPLGFADIQKYGQGHPGLKTVVCKGHHISEVGSNLLGTVSHDDLTSLDLSNNGIKRINSGAFHHMKNLKHLILDTNLWNVEGVTDLNLFTGFNLTSISLNHAFSPPDQQVVSFLRRVFANSMQSLRSLSLSHNSLRALPMDFFHGMPDLQHLDLSRNQLKSFDVGMLNLSKLMTLRLNNNAMVVMDEALLIELSKLYNNGLGTLKNVTLAGNPIACNVSAVPLYHWLKSSNKSLILDADRIKCATALAKDLVGKPIIKLSEKQLKSTPKKSGQSYVVLAVVLGLVAVLAVIILILNRSFFISKYLACKETVGSKHDFAIYGAKYSSVR